jgi:hypothetical protein
MGREPQVVLYLGRAAAGVLEIESGRQWTVGEDEQRAMRLHEWSCSETRLRICMER